jgi:hypothetical protein
MMTLDQESINNEQLPPPYLSEKPSRWLIGLHLFGGGLLSNSLQISRELPDFGAIPFLVLLVAGYFGSKVLVDTLWKKFGKKHHRIMIGVSLVPAYLLISVLLPWSIDSVLK